MVEHFDAEELSGLDELTRDLDILTAGRRIAGRVIVVQDQRWRTREQGPSKHFPRTNDARRPPALREDIVAQEAVTSIEQQHAEAHDPGVAESRRQVAHHLLRVTHRMAATRQPHADPATELEHRRQSRPERLPDPVLHLLLGQGARRELAQAASFIDEVPRHLER